MYYVYILASRRNGTLYTGVTGRIIGRVSQHKQKLTPGFTSRYGVDLLVWYEPHENVQIAIRREKRLKKWLRAWKVALIEQTNPLWLDLYPEFFATAPGPLTGIPRFPNPDSRCSPASPL
jgi:putative endonuclease